MNSRVIASLLALCLTTSSAAALQGNSTFSIEYPIRGYRLGDDPPDKQHRASDLARLEERLTRSTSIVVAEPAGRARGISPVTGLSLGRTIRPIRILWNDPRYLFREAATVEWIELVDERGRITRVWVTSSNQEPYDDERIIGWCTNDALWQPVELEGRSSSVLRTAGVSLSGSPYHYSTWKEELATGPGLVVAAAGVLILFWLLAHVVRYKRHQRMRHEQLMTRLHRASPYKPPSIDDETQ
jgi:hypothetical protein